MGNRESKEANAAALQPREEAAAGQQQEEESVTPSAATGAAAAASSPRPAPVGEWESPITSAFITEKAVRLGSPQLRASDGALFWLEGRPDEGGRQVLVMRSPDGSTRDITPAVSSGFNVRTTVHEYGGFEYCLVGDSVYFSNFSDQALYVQDLGGGGGGGGSPSAPRLVTHGSVDRGERFADACWDAQRRRLVSVSELHRDEATGAELPPDKVVNRLVAVDVSSGSVTPLASGAHFYAAPRPSPCGRWLAWLEWDWPNMPWDCTRLMVAAVRQDGSVGDPTLIAGGDEGGSGSGGGGSAVQQPVWSPDGGHLYFIDDKTGWWNLYRCRTPPAAGGLWAAAAAAADVEALCPSRAEWGFPMWSLDTRSYQVLSDGCVLAVMCDPGQAGAALVLLAPPPLQQQQPVPGSGGGEGGSGGGWVLTRLNTGFTHFGSPVITVRERPPTGGSGGSSGSGSGSGSGVGSGSGAPGLTVAAVAASPSRAAAVVQCTADSAAALAGVGPGGWREVRRSSESQIPEGYLSVPEALSYPTTLDGQPTTAHMLLYPPTNKSFCHPPGCPPPLLVHCHGGPTSAAGAALSPTTQYWTSRGFAVADVDYGGSTGYGREYRNRLRGRWGVVDVQDCCAAAEWLRAGGRAHPARLCISGGSAGGFTTLACLAFRRTFSAGASLYGVADLRLLAEHTHKFESRYLDLLVGPLPAAAEVYAARSPLQHAEQLAAPVVFFQGDQDRVVPPEQAVRMHEAVRKRGLPTGLVMMAGEQHGFRQAVNIRTALDGELYFYGAVLGFKANMPEDLPKIKIDNLPSQSSA